MYRILLVEDDGVIASQVEKHLNAWGYQVRRAADYQHILTDFAAFQPHLVLLDIGLPFYNGYHWCAEIRRHSKIPILFLSSASDNMNIVMAMNQGGDDFVAKPFDLDVLTAKIQGAAAPDLRFRRTDRSVEHRGALLNTGDATLTYDGRKVELSKNEYKILLTLLSNKGKIVSRETLMTKLWETDSFVDENTLTVNITRPAAYWRRRVCMTSSPQKKGAGYLVE